MEAHELASTQILRSSSMRALARRLTRLSWVSLSSDYYVGGTCIFILILYELFRHASIWTCFREYQGLEQPYNGVRSFTFIFKFYPSYPALDRTWNHPS